MKQEFRTAKRADMAAISEWIKEPDLDARMRGQREDLPIVRPCLRIIDQQADMHAAICRPQQGSGQQLTGLVAAKNEILKVERSFCGADQLDADRESFSSDSEYPKSR